MTLYLEYTSQVKLFRDTYAGLPGQFPVRLFTVATMEEFRNMMGFTADDEKVCRLLGISLQEFQVIFIIVHCEITSMPLSNHMRSHQVKPTAWVYVIYCESVQSAP